MTILVRASSIPEPAVSFVLAAHNAERFVEEAVRSILAQPGPPFEVVIIDDASTDHTLQALLNFFDPRITLLRLDKKLFVSGARNRAFPFVRAPWMCIFDADDIMQPNAFAPYFHAVTSNPATQWGYCAMRHVDAAGKPNGNETRNRFDFVKMLLINILPHPMALLKTDLYQKIGGYDETLSHSVDYDLWLKAMEWTDPFFWNRTGVDYRRHGDCIGTTNRGPRLVHESMRRRVQQPHAEAIVQQRRSWMRQGLILMDAAQSGQWAQVIAPALWLREQGVNSFVLDYYLATALNDAGRAVESIPLCSDWIQFLAKGGFLNGDEASNLAILSLKTGIVARERLWLESILPIARLIDQYMPTPELSALLAEIGPTETIGKKSSAPAL